VEKASDPGSNPGGAIFGIYIFGYKLIKRRID